MVLTSTERLTLGTDKVRLCLTLPSLPENAKTPLRKGFACYYGGMRKGFLRFAKTRLLKLNASLPIGAVLKTVPCHESAKAVSLCVDAAVTVDGERRTARISQLWSKESGALVPPRRLFVKRCRQRLLCVVEREALKRAESVGAALYSDWRSILRRRFDRRRLCISPHGAVFFFPARVLCERNEPFTVPVAAEELLPFLKAGEAERLWGLAE